MTIAEDKELRITKLTLGPYETNAYILVCAKTKESLVIDAPAKVRTIIEELKGTKPQSILLTHDHPDHTGAMTSLRSRLKVPLATHECSSFQLETPPDFLLKDGDVIKLGNLKIDVIFTPGHTPGSLCFKVNNYLFDGDTLFPGGPGHTDTPDDFKQILSSITQNIYSLPDDTLILPGHGESTTVKKSKEEYAVFAATPHDELYGDVTWLSR
jgi:glyoxylase-like metal-dependent hydrolase (beta-lactamase superfamily II)